MDLHDFGSLVWAIFIAIAVISSLVRSARRSAGAPQQRAAPQRVATPRPPAPPVQVYIPPPVAAQPNPVAMPPEPPPLIVPSTAASAAHDSYRKWHGLFAQGNPIVQGIVAREVFGLSRALDEWTPGLYG
jgi:hypothetical protein